MEDGYWPAARLRASSSQLCHDRICGFQSLVPMHENSALQRQGFAAKWVTEMTHISGLNGPREHEFQIQRCVLRMAR